MWITRKLKNFIARNPRNNISEIRLDPNDNIYRRAKFENKAAGGLNGQLFRRTANFIDPTPLDEEQL